jgi:hypothetical protein
MERWDFFGSGDCPIWLLAFLAETVERRRLVSLTHILSRPIKPTGQSPLNWANLEKRKSVADLLL